MCAQCPGVAGVAEVVDDDDDDGEAGAGAGGVAVLDEPFDGGGGGGGGAALPQLQPYILFKLAAVLYLVQVGSLSSLI